LTFPLSKEMRDLIGDMIYACRKFNGVGLAAPQIGKNLNLAIINLEHYDLPPFPIINPVIVSKSFTKTNMEEGCLSIPGKFAMVRRPEKIKVEFYNAEGEKISTKLDGFIAKVFQHEIDHLGGTLIKDKWDEKTLSVHVVRKTRKKRRK